MYKMYFVEILSKILNNKNLLSKFIKPEKQEDFDNNQENCEHMFVPIDSTGKVFACIHCGLVLNEKPKNLNFFEGEK